MKLSDSTANEFFEIKKSHPKRNETKRIKRILDTEYKKINLIEIVNNLNYSKDNYENSSLKLLQKYEEMFDEILSNCTDSNYTIELTEDSKSYHAKHFPISKFHEPSHKKYLIGVLSKINNF